MSYGMHAASPSACRDVNAMSSNARRRNSARRNAALRYVRESGKPCWICGCAIDYDIPQGDPLCCECDEIVPVSKGGDPFDFDNVLPAHRCCNAWRGAKSPETVRMIQEEVIKEFVFWASPLDFVEKAREVVRRERLIRRHKTVAREDTTTDW